MCVCVWCVFVCLSPLVDLRRQLVRVCSLLPPCDFWEIKRVVSFGSKNFYSLNCLAGLNSVISPGVCLEEYFNSLFLTYLKWGDFVFICNWYMLVLGEARRGIRSPGSVVGQEILRPASWSWSWGRMWVLGSEPRSPADISALQKFINHVSLSDSIWSFHLCTIWIYIYVVSVFYSV